MKQKTLEHFDIEELDKKVNDFESTHKVKATQSYAVFTSNIITHFRVLFYEE